MKKWNVATVRAAKGVEKLGCCTAYDSCFARLTTAGIPVLAHVGMTPQSVNQYGGFKKQGKTREQAEKVPSFVKKYANLAETVRGAFAAYVGDVKAGNFPG